MQALRLRLKKGDGALAHMWQCLDGPVVTLQVPCNEGGPFLACPCAIFSNSGAVLHLQVARALGAGEHQSVDGDGSPSRCAWFGAAGDGGDCWLCGSDDAELLRRANAEVGGYVTPAGNPVRLQAGDFWSLLVENRANAKVRKHKHVYSCRPQ